ncbi:MAG: tetratricopeptide repeat protein [Burkholderiaceae bacterium]|nr:tetratricopeptide repeat protein [Burkholderiaceae bacterium]
MQVRFPIGRVAWRLNAALASMALACAVHAAEAPKPTVVQEPHYGDTLFRFWQDQYFTAITGLMTSQHFNRVAQHADEAEVLRGGMLLSYGMHKEAGEIFAQLIEKGAAPSVRDRAWYYLAKIRYQRGFIDQAEEAVARIENNLPPALQEERVLLQSQLLMARGDFAGAAQVLEALAKSSSAGLYARYNLGVALVRSGDLPRGIAMLDEVGKAPATTEEFKALRDKANVALGYAALADEKPEAARAFLERVRLSSMLANKALLGFGWASAALKEPKKALVPWNELVSGAPGRDSGDAAVLEARIAVAFAYAELGAYGQSLERYQDAINAFDREHVALDESIGAIRKGKLLDGLLEKNPGDEMGWFWNIQELPEMPHASHLNQVLAQHEFQEAFKNWRDLRFLAKNLQGWADTLGVYNDMLSNRRQAYADKLPKVRDDAGKLNIAESIKRRDALVAELEKAEAEADHAAVADAARRIQIERVADVQALMQRAGADPEVAAAAERVRRVAGALTWQLAQEFPDRLWTLKKALRTINMELELAQARDAALAQAQRDEPARHEAFARRIAALEGTIRALIPKVAALTSEQQGQVQELAVAELTRQKERLAAYTTQARFAVAQLYDRAALARKPDEASKP